MCLAAVDHKREENNTLNILSCFSYVKKKVKKNVKFQIFITFTFFNIFKIKSV